MVRSALVFLSIAFIAAIFAFGGVPNPAAELAQVVFYVFLVLFVGVLTRGMMSPRTR